MFEIILIAIVIVGGIYWWFKRRKAKEEEAAREHWRKMQILLNKGASCVSCNSWNKNDYNCNVVSSYWREKYGVCTFWE